LAPYIELARLDESFARFVTTLEDLQWSGASTGQVKVAPRSDLNDEQVAAAVTEIRRVFGVRAPGTAERLAGSRSGAGALHDEGLPDLVFQEFTDSERYLLVLLRFIGEPNPLRELLGLAVHANSQYLDYLEDASAGDAARALLLALSWGDDSAPRVSLSATMQNAEMIIDADCRRMVAEQEMPDQEMPEQLGQALADAHRIDCALPLVALDADEFMGVTAPRLSTIPRHYFEELSKNGVYRILSFEREYALEGRRRDQVAMRQRLKPEAVVYAEILTRQQQLGAFKLGGNARWNDGTKRVCAAWLAIAVAYRQVGLIDPAALRAALSCVGLIDRGAALILSRALATGLPGWRTLSDSSVADQYKQVTAIWQDLHHSSDDSDELGNPSDTVEHALALTHAGKHRAALEITERLIQRLEPVTDGTDLEHRYNVLSTHAYALAHTGQAKAALALIAPEIPNLPRLSLYEQCEFLHLLADLMQHQEKPAAAIRYLLQERALRSPALHRRLHNRSHLLELLTADGQDQGLISQIAVEGLAFASAAQEASQAESFAALLIDRASLLSKEEREQILDCLPDESSLTGRPAATVARIAFKTTSGDSLDAQQRAVLESQLGSTGPLKAFACFRLASQPDTPVEEKVRLLRLASEEPGLHGGACGIMLLDALWEAEDWPGLGEHAVRLRPAYPTFGGVHAALGASAYKDGRHHDAIEHMARAFCYASAIDVLKASPRLHLIFQESANFPLEVTARTMSMLEELTDQIEGGMDAADTIVPRMSLSEVIDRVYDYNRDADPLDHRVIDTLIMMSERAWDHANYPVAINARRRACQLIERTDDHTAKLAIQLGWLATLVKQAGNVEEALSLYQRAISAGSDRLSPTEESSLLERYANLLHQIGAYEPAVRTQWLAILAQKQKVHRPENSFPPAPETLDDALDPDGLDATALDGWPLLAANFANCLESAGHYELAVRALRAALFAVKATDVERPAVMTVPNDQEFNRLLRGVTAKLAARGIDVASYFALE
jgi:tetratricopeptide (TPR) repeat protein